MQDLVVVLFQPGGLSRCGSLVLDFDDPSIYDELVTVGHLQHHGGHIDVAFDVKGGLASKQRASCAQMPMKPSFSPVTGSRIPTWRATSPANC